MDEIINNVKVIIKGKRIWWKPWKRRETVYSFDNVKISTEDFLNFSFYKN